MFHKYYWVIAGLLGIAISLGACGSDGSDEQQQEPLELVVMSWYNDEGESAALDAIVNTYIEQFPEVTVINGTVTWRPNEVETQTYAEVIELRFEAGEPPDIFQFNNMYKLREGIAAGNVAPLTEVMANSGGDEQFPEGLLDAVSVDGVPYAVPLNIMRNGIMYYNTSVFAAAGVTDDQVAALKDGTATWDDLFVVAETIQTYYEDQGINGTAFSIPQSAGDVTSDEPGRKYPWTMKDAFFTCILPGTLSMAQFDTLESDAATVEDFGSADVVQAFENMGRYVQLANPDFLGDCADYETTDECRLEIAPWLAIQNTADLPAAAAMVTMGDFFVRRLRDADQEFGTDWDIFPCPGMGDMFLAQADMFVLAEGAPNPEQGEAFLEVAADPAVEVEFNLASGNIPPRADAAVTTEAGFDDYQLASSEALGVNEVRTRLESNVVSDFSDNWIGPVGDFATAILALDPAAADYETQVTAEAEAAAQALSDLCASAGHCQ